MCVIQPCANPTEVGVWWRDDTIWCRYEAANEALIRRSVRQKLRSIDLGSIKSAVHPQGWRYTADLEKMEQVAVSTGQKRSIMIIDAPAAAPLQLPAPRHPVVAVRIPPPQGNVNVTATVHYRDSSGQMQQYDQGVARALLEAVVGGKQTHVVLRDDRRDECLLFDLQMMKQRVVASMDDETGDVVLSDDDPVDFFIEVPWSPTAMAAVAKSAGKEMRRKILQMVIDRYRSDQHLDAVLPAKAHPRTIVSKRMNDAMMPGHPTYEMFLDCLEDVIGQSRDAFDLLIKSTDTTLPSDCDDGERSILKLAFKPFGRDQDQVRNSNSSPNVKRKLSARQTTSLWMSMLAPAAAAHAVVYGCTIQLRILVYFVIFSPGKWQREALADASGSPPGSDCVSIDNPGHHLQVGEVVLV